MCAKVSSVIDTKLSHSGKVVSAQQPSTSISGRHVNYTLHPEPTKEEVRIAEGMLDDSIGFRELNDMQVMAI